MNSKTQRMTYSYFALLIGLGFLTCAVSTIADDRPTQPGTYKHQITGLFMKDREADLRTVCENLSGIKLIAIDYENAEATFEYDPTKVFPNSKPEQVVDEFNNRLKSVSNHTFGVKPLRTIPREKLKLIEISIVGLDCKACSLAVYEIVYKLKGVEQATASFKEGRLTAWIDPERTDRVELEMAMKQRGVTLKGSE